MFDWLESALNLMPYWRLCIAWGLAAALVFLIFLAIPDDMFASGLGIPVAVAGFLAGLYWEFKQNP